MTFIEIGERLGDYEIIGLISSGGMSFVYRGRHVHFRRKRVALKILRPEQAYQKDIVYRFRREARVVSRLRHPNIPKVYDFIELADRTPPVYCMVMELLNGCDLGSHIEARGMLEPPAAVIIGRQVADALSVLHGASILHRDVKPANIFLAPRADDELHVKLLDFGLVKGTATEHRTKLTGENRVAGTPEYMAPEQFLDEEVGAQADIYSLGASLYEMLSGRPPFGIVAEHASYVDFMLKIANREIAPIADRRPAELSPVPPALEALIRRCLSRDPAQRFAHAVELSEALLVSLMADDGCDFEPEEPTLGVSAVQPSAYRASWLLAAAAAVLAAVVILLLLC